MRTHNFRFSVLVMSISLFAAVSFFFVLTLWKNSLEHIYAVHKISLIAINDLQLKTLEVKMHFLAYTGPYGCSACTKTKVKDKAEQIDKVFALLQIEASDLDSLRAGKTDLEQFINKAFEVLNKEDKDKISLMLDDDWAVVITNFIKPLNQLSSTYLSAVENSYVKSMQWIQSLTWLFSIVILGHIALITYFLYRHLKTS